MFRAITFVSLLLATPTFAYGESIRCNSRIVSTVDTVVSLFSHCGQPLYTYSHPSVENISIFVPGIGLTSKSRTRIIQTLLYAFHGSLLRIIEVADGKVLSIKTGGRLSADGPERCIRGLFSDLNTIGEVQVTCGAPLHRSSSVDEILIERHGLQVRKLVTTERLIYSAGPDRFLRILTFENGRLVKQETAERSP